MPLQISRMGLVMDVQGVGNAVYIVEDSVEYLRQQEKARTIWMYILTLAGHFIEGFIHLQESYPGKLNRVLAEKDGREMREREGQRERRRKDRERERRERTRGERGWR